MAIDQGKELLQWDIKESHIHERGVFWYIAAGIAVVALIIYAITTRNFLFAFILIMFGIIVVTHSLRPVIEYKAVITERGFKLGERFYPWKDIEKFWIVNEPPEVKMLYFNFGGLRPRLPVHLENVDPIQVRSALVDKITEDTSSAEEPISDWLARKLKI